MATNKKSLDNIERFYRTLPDDRRAFAEKLVAQLKWMEKTLDDLQKIVREEGPVVIGTNGNGFTVRNEHPAQKSYNTMIKNYNSTIRQLVDLLPSESEKEPDELEKFLGTKK